MKNNKGFGLVGILIVLGVVLIIGGVYYFNKNLNTSLKNIDENSNVINKNTNITCGSNEIPLIQKGEQIKKEAREDLDNDGIKELLVVYEKMIPGWEGMPMPSDRFVIFTCENNKFVASYKIDSYPSNTFDFINYETSKAVFLGGREGWHLLVKNGKEFEKLSSVNERLQVIEKLGLAYNDGYHISAKIVNNMIEETLPGHAPGDALCCPSKPEVKIIYEFKDNNFIIISTNGSKKVTVNGREFKYPETWSCEYITKDISYPNVYPCNNDIINSHTFTFHLYPTENNTNNSMYFLSVDPSDSQCLNWLRVNTYKHQSCLSMGGGKNYAVYTDSNMPSIVSGFDSFVKTNKVSNTNSN